MFEKLFYILYCNSCSIKAVLLVLIPVSFLVALVLPEKCNGYSYSIWLLVIVCNFAFNWFIDTSNNQYLDVLTKETKQVEKQYYQTKLEELQK